MGGMSEKWQTGVVLRAEEWALACDLDGTLLPLKGQPWNRWALRRLDYWIQRTQLPFMFATGRPYVLTRDEIAAQGMPRPRWIVCDVGASIYEWRGGDFIAMDDYREHLRALAGGLCAAELHRALGPIEGLQLQEDWNQAEFKLAYFAAPELLEPMVAELQRRLEAQGLAYNVIAHVDVFCNLSLIDLLPKSCNKAMAVQWLAQHGGFSADHVVYAGDSGNDFAALTAGFRAIIMGNAVEELAESVQKAHVEKGLVDCYYRSRFPATSGVLEGCAHYGLFPESCLILEGGHLGGVQGFRLPLGALPEGEGARLRVWAPGKSVVQALAEGAAEAHPLLKDRWGYFSAQVPFPVGTTYRLCPDHAAARPDPASRFQPQDVHGPSQVTALPPVEVEPSPSVALEDLVIYELHIGTFTAEGTYRAAMPRLSELRELGVTAIELMPLAQPAGQRNWGYDGVNLFAPQFAYGTPEDLRAFLDAAHRAGLLVLLDVVYNHLGPEGNYLAEFAPYLDQAHQTPWGPGLSFDAPEVRNFLLANALYWLSEYRFDGLRLDAVRLLGDETRPCWVDELSVAVEALGEAQGRKLWLFGETNLYEADYLHHGGLAHRPLDGIWCDDLAHALFATATPQHFHGHREYRPGEDLQTALERGYVFDVGPQGTPERRRESPRAELERLVVGLQNHDWVGNDPQGQRFTQATTQACHQAAAALVLLYPAIPLLFMGEEFAAQTPFYFFTDFHDAHLQQAVADGRRREFPHHDWSQTPAPNCPEARQRSVLEWPETSTMREWYQQLLALRAQWRQDGLLVARNLRIQSVPEAGVYALSYQEGPQTVFVAVRLKDEGPEVALEGIEKVLLADSRQKISEPAIVFRECRTITGFGSICLSVV